MVNLTDKGTIVSQITDARGFMRVKARFSKVGIQVYTAKELGLQGRPPSDKLRILRPEEEVFATDSMQSFDNCPVTDDHPPENVTAENARQYQVGHQVGSRTRDGDNTAGEIILTDASVIAKMANGKVEISDGYACEIELTPGVWNGQQYDGRKKNIRGNHTALVGAGRCGGSCRVLLDGKMCEECAAGTETKAPCGCHGGENDMSTGGQASPQLVPRIVDGLTIQTTEHGAQVIDKLQAQLADAKKAAEDAAAALEKATAEHKTAVDAKDGEITGLKEQLSDAALDARATERADMINTVQAVLGKTYDPLGKTNVQMMTDALTQVYGAETVKDRSEDYLKGLFATVKDKAGKLNVDPVQRQVSDSLRTPIQVQTKDNDGQLRGRDAYLKRLQSGGRTAAAGQGN